MKLIYLVNGLLHDLIGVETGPDGSEVDFAADTSSAVHEFEPSWSYI